MENNRSKLQTKLETTRWQPFCFVTPTGAIVSNPQNAAFSSSAMMATAIIAKMMYTVANEGRRLKSPKS